MIAVSGIDCLLFSYNKKEINNIIIKQSDNSQWPAIEFQQVNKQNEMN